MRQPMILVAPLAMFAFATSVLAGGAGCTKEAMDAKNAAYHKGCTATKEECLKHMAEAKNNGWLGIQYDATEDGTSVVKEVVKGSPADKAGFRAGDVLFALNGIEMNDANKDRVKSTWKSLKPGSVVSYTVKREGISKELTPTLGTMPEATYQAMVAEHMKEHVAVASN
jgi:predicted metalloprotease with PDZ domain